MSLSCKTVCGSRPITVEVPVPHTGGGRSRRGGAASSSESISDRIVEQVVEVPVHGFGKKSSRSWAKNSSVWRHKGRRRHELVLAATCEGPLPGRKTQKYALHEANGVFLGIQLIVLAGCAKPAFHRCFLLRRSVPESLGRNWPKSPKSLVTIGTQPREQQSKLSHGAGCTRHDFTTTSSDLAGPFPDTSRASRRVDCKSSNTQADCSRSSES